MDTGTPQAQTYGSRGVSTSNNRTRSVPGAPPSLLLLMSSAPPPRPSTARLACGALFLALACAVLVESAILFKVSGVGRVVGVAALCATTLTLTVMCVTSPGRSAAPSPEPAPSDPWTARRQRRPETLTATVAEASPVTEVNAL